MRNLELPGRSTVHAMDGMAATSHPLSSEAAIDMLKSGGNAMDAAIAACAAQCVVEPGSTGIGGDCFVLYAPEGSDEIIAFDGSGRAPAGLNLDWLEKQGINEIDRHSPHAVTLPGAIDAWTRLLSDYGTKSLADVFARAIHLAKNGYPVSPRVSIDWHLEFKTLDRDKNAAQVFLPKGRAMKVGEIHRQPALAKTLETIAREGRDGFYKGDIAKDMVDYLNSLGGVHTLKDFAETHGQYVTSIHSEFRGYQVHQCPPAGQGVVALILLNILKDFGPECGHPTSPQRLHLEIEATKLAYGVRDAYVADPEYMTMPVEHLLSDDFAAKLRHRIDPGRAMTALPDFGGVPHESTVYITVVDKDRNTVSFINSLFNVFGSGLMAPKSGIMLQNRGQGFVLEKDHPNCIKGGKRPLHTIIPAMTTKDGKVDLCFGVMGGAYQAMGHAHFLTRVLDFGMDIQQAIDAPRLFPKPGLHGVEAEGTFLPQTINALKDLGHVIGPPPKPIGGAQAIRIDWKNNALTGASEPRKDGLALGY